MTRTRVNFNMVTVVVGMGMREMNKNLNLLVGRPVKAIANDHYTVRGNQDAIHDPKFLKVIDMNAKIILFGMLLRVEDDYIAIASSWFMHSDEQVIDEYHKILKCDIIKVEELHGRDANGSNE